MGDPSLVGRPHEVDGKEILHFKGFILVPPPPNSAPRSTREKPPGCKTVFVGGLPETVTEDMIGELLQTCGSKCEGCQRPLHVPCMPRLNIEFVLICKMVPDTSR